MLIWLVDTRTWKPVGAPLLANASQFAIDPADRLLATASTAADVQLWDVRSGRPLGDVLPGLARGPAPIGFVAGGRALVTLRQDGKGIVWDVLPRSWARRACAVAARSLTADEWHDTIPELSFAPVCAVPH